ncbi:hypothetical protein HK099_005349 [Clydaea vesicula]|uniref:Uncharacterized protein n=1 Tax=Clydaea vesicula TaxID=447962 RepID=A0AAD5U0G0_9FUNG|nr:hypothetical protein HK099_005349 [Clydaea vesicula]
MTKSDPDIKEHISVNSPADGKQSHGEKPIVTKVKMTENEREIVGEKPTKLTERKDESAR